MCFFFKENRSQQTEQRQQIGCNALALIEFLVLPSPDPIFKLVELKPDDQLRTPQKFIIVHCAQFNMALN
jgi:hypothetical protein